jgi:hypothetical protein
MKNKGIKRKNKVVQGEERSSASKVWVNPNSTFKGPQGNRAWEGSNLATTTAARLLELADTALGFRKSPSSPTKRKAAA